MGKIGRAILELIVDKKDLDKGLGEGVKSVLDFEGAVKGVGKAIAGAFAVTAIVGAATAVVGLAGDLTDLHAKTGIGTTALQELKYAGSQVGVELEQVTRGVTDMQKRLAGGDASAVGAVKALGLNFDDLRAMKPEDQFRTLAERIADVEDPADRVKVAMDLFGRSGAEMLPLLTDEFTGLMDRASELGVVMDEETVASMDLLGDTVGDLMDVGMALLGKVLAPFVPFLTQLANAALWVADILGDTLGWAIDQVGEGLAWLGRQVIGLMRSYVQMQQGIADMMPWLSEKLGITQGLAKADEWLASAERSLSGEQEKTAVAADKSAKAHERLDLSYGKTKTSTDAATKAQQAYNKEIQALADDLTGKKVGAEIQKYTDALRLAEQQGGLSAFQSADLAKKLEELRQKAGALPPELQAIADRAAFMARTFKDAGASVAGFTNVVPGVSVFPWDKAGGPFSVGQNGSSWEREWDQAVRESDRQQASADLWRNFGQDASASWSMGFDDGLGTDPISALSDVFVREERRLAAEAAGSGSKLGGAVVGGLKDGLSAATDAILGALQGGGDVLESAAAALGSSIGGGIGKGIGTALGGPVGGEIGQKIGAFLGSLTGKLFSGNDTKKDREAAAKMLGFSSLAALNDHLRTLGADGAALVHEGLNEIGKKDKDRNNAWIQSVQALIDKHKELAGVVADGIPEGARGFPTRAELEEAAKAAGDAYAYMRDSGLYTSDVLKDAWQDWQDALVASGDAGALSLQKIRGEMDQLNSEYDQVFGSIKDELANPEYDEAGNRVYGVIEAQGIARMEAIERERAALKEKADAEQAESEVRLEETGKKVVAVGQTVREGMEQLFEKPLKVPVHFDMPWGTWGADAGLPGMAGAFTGPTFTINHTTNLDGRVVARNQVQYQGEALEMAGYA